MDKNLIIELTQLNIIPALDELSSIKAQAILNGRESSNQEIAALRQAFVAGFIEDRFGKYFDKIIDSSVMFFNYLNYHNLSPEDKLLVKNMYYWNTKIGRQIALSCLEEEFTDKLAESYSNGDLITDPFTDTRSEISSGQIPEKLLPYEEVLNETITALFSKLDKIAHEMQMDDILHLHNQEELAISNVTNQLKTYSSHLATQAQFELRNKIGNMDDSLSDEDKLAKKLSLAFEYNKKLEELSNDYQNILSDEIATIHNKYEEKIAYTLDHIEIYEEIAKYTMEFSEELKALNGIRQFYDECAIVTIYNEYQDNYILV